MSKHQKEWSVLARVMSRCVVCEDACVKVPTPLFLLSGNKLDKHGLQCLVEPLIKSVCLQKMIEFDILYTQSTFAYLKSTVHTCPLNSSIHTHLRMVGCCESSPYP